MLVERVLPTGILLAAGLAIALVPGASWRLVRASVPPPVVEISAKRFEFVPNQITLNQGETVVLRLTTQDVKHGFFMRELGIDALIEPGRATDVTVTPEAKGTFTIICDHFCGQGHSNMHMKVIVE